MSLTTSSVVKFTLCLGNKKKISVTNRDLVLSSFACINIANESKFSKVFVFEEFRKVPTRILR